MSSAPQGSETCRGTWLASLNSVTPATNGVQKNIHLSNSSSNRLQDHEDQEPFSSRGEQLS